MMVGIMAAQSHGRALLAGAVQRMAIAGVDPKKLRAVATQALSATRPLPPGVSRYVPKGYRLLPDGSLVAVEVLSEDDVRQRLTTGDVTPHYTRMEVGVE